MDQNQQYIPRRLIILVSILTSLSVTLVFNIIILGSSASSQTIMPNMMPNTYMSNTTPVSQTKAEITSVAATSLFSDYYLTEPATFYLRNNSANDVALRNSAPWYITDAYGRTVFSPISLQVITYLKPYQVKQWSWNQKNNSGNYVPAGNYKIIFSDFKNVSVPIIIKNKLGSSGFFTFGSIVETDKETFRVLISNPLEVRNAIDNYYKLNTKHIPNGLLVDDRPKKSPYDSQWSWHIDPNNIRMQEVSIELCDGRPSFVENDLDYWINSVKQFCPWSYNVKELK